MNKQLRHSDPELNHPEASVIPKRRMVGPLFIVTLRPLAGIDPAKALRGALKTLLRKYGLRVSAISEYNEAHDSPDRLADEHPQNGSSHRGSGKKGSAVTADSGNSKISLSQRR